MISLTLGISLILPQTTEKPSSLVVVAIFSIVLVSKNIRMVLDQHLHNAFIEFYNILSNALGNLSYLGRRRFAEFPRIPQVGDRVLQI